MSEKEKLTLGGVLYNIGCAILSVAAVIFVVIAVAVNTVWGLISKPFNKNEEK